MNLLSRLQQLLELDSPAEEATRKFVDTYMNVNGVCMRIQIFDYKGNKILGTCLDENEMIVEKVVPFKSLDIWLPDSGYYRNKHGKVFYLKKMPKRQWYKSFHPSFYDCSVDYEKDYFLLMDAEPVKIHIDGANTINVFNRPIGKITDGKIYCTDSLFEQELLDWKRDGHFQRLLSI